MPGKLTCSSSTPLNSYNNGGLIITGPPLGEIVPLERAAMAKRVVVQWAKESLEWAGLIKPDLLSLQALDMIQETVRLVRQHEGVFLDLDCLPSMTPQPTTACARPIPLAVFKSNRVPSNSSSPGIAPGPFRTWWCRSRSFGQVHCKAAWSIRISGGGRARSRSPIPTRSSHPCSTTRRASSCSKSRSSR
jgi:hypothetical protein